MPESDHLNDGPENTASHAIVVTRDRLDTYSRACRGAYERGYQDAIKQILSAVEQLRDDIHRNPTANTDPTPMMRKFAKGERVQLSPRGIQNFPRWPADLRGTVAHNSSKRCIPVKWDGMKTAQYLYRNLLEPADD